VGEISDPFCTQSTHKYGVPTSLMSVHAPTRTEALFYEVFEMPPAERASFLAGECAEDTATLAEVEELLRAYDEAEQFMEGRKGNRDHADGAPGSAGSERPGEAVGHYRLVEQIGEGGFGTVWIAEQERPVRRTVALKIIKLGMDTRNVVARFEQERQALAMMEHSAIAKVFDAGSTKSGRPYFVMELVKGVKITRFCDDAGLRISERLQLFIQICAAVQHAHQKGIIHRDLKPSNILATCHDGVPTPKIIDFGVAKATEQQRLGELTVHTQVDQVIGTPLYMSPEQVGMGGLDIDTRSDIYSLGVLLYELLTGRPPFDPQRLLQAGFHEMQRVLREEEPPRPSTSLSILAAPRLALLAQSRQVDGPKLVAQVRGDLDWIVMKALEKDRSRRYQTASSLAQDLERYLANEPIQARPADPIYRFRRWVRRNRAAAIAAGAIAVSVTVGLIGTTSQAMRAGREAKRANEALRELRSSAPAFAEQAQALVAKEEFDEAVKKLGEAIKLRPDAAEYRARIGDILRSQLRFSEAAAAYQGALQVDAGNARYRSNLNLCKAYGKELKSNGKLSRESLVTLFRTMKSEMRPAAELMTVGKLLGEQNAPLLQYWTERLAGLPLAPAKPITTRLSASEAGELILDLSESGIADLRPLAGMPLASLDLSGCDKITDIEPLRGMPLRTLILAGTDVVELRPLGTMPNLRALDLSYTRVSNLEPLRTAPLDSLNLKATRVEDLTPLSGTGLRSLLLTSTPVVDVSPLKGLPLRELDLSSTGVESLAALAGMPLERFEGARLRVYDFSALSGAKLQQLNVQSSWIRDLSILRGMPLKVLNVNYTKEARGFEILPELTTLEELTLPNLYDLTDSEFAAVGRLKELPAFRSLRIGTETEPGAPKFWRIYEGMGRGRQVNAEAKRLCEAGRFGEAADVIGPWIHATSGRGETGYTEWAAYGALLLASGDWVGYQEVCERMVTQFRTRLSGDSVAAGLCLLSPDSQIPLREIRRLLPHRALASTGSVYYCEFVLRDGLFAYRMGRPREAIDILWTMQTEAFPSTLAAGAAVLAMAYGHEGEFDLADAHLERAQGLLRPSAESDLLERYHWGGRLNARLLLAEALSVVSAQRSSAAGPPLENPEDEQIFPLSPLSLARLSQIQGDLPSAEGHLRTALAAVKQRIGSGSMSVMDCLARLAGVLTDPGRQVEAARIKAEAGALTADREARELFRKRRFREAAVLLESAVASARIHLEADHDALAGCLRKLAYVRVKEGEMEEAESILRDLKTASGRKDDPALLSSWAFGAESRNEMEEAEAILRIQLAIGRRSPQTEALEQPLRLLGDHLHRRREYQEANELYREFVELRTARLPAGDEALLGVRTVFARMLMEWAWSERGAGRIGLSAPSTSHSTVAPTPKERAIEAERILREVLALRSESSCGEAWRTHDVARHIAAALINIAIAEPPLTGADRNGCLGEAEQLLISSHDALQTVSGGAYRSAVLWLGRLYEAWGKAAEAEKWNRLLQKMDADAKSKAAN
jgi:serine/threonine protein kinase